MNVSQNLTPSPLDQLVIAPDFVHVLLSLLELDFVSLTLLRSSLQLAMVMMLYLTKYAIWQSSSGFAPSLHLHSIDF